MSYLMSILMLGLVFGFVLIASNPSPLYGALVLVVVSLVGCELLAEHDVPFLSLVLLLIYLGGMLVVFCYSAALAADPYPETPGTPSVALKAVVYLVMVGVAAGALLGGWHVETWPPADELGGFSLMRADTAGVASMYSVGWGLLLLAVWGLLLALFVVLNVCRGATCGSLRPL